MAYGRQREVRNCAKLELLNLSNNRLRSLPSEVGVLVELRQLDVFKNHLEALPAEIGELPVKPDQEEDLMVFRVLMLAAMVCFMGGGDGQAT